MKRIIGLLLALVMTVSLAACASTAPASPAAAEPAAAVEEAEAAAPEGELSPYEQAIADRRAEYEKTGVYPKVVFSFYDWTGAPEGTARVQEAMNKILREKLCLEVELLILDSAVYTQDVRLMLSSGEQVDWFNSAGLGYSSVVNAGYCTDLEEDELMQKYGPHMREILGDDYMNACRISGTLYGIPQMREYAMRVVTCICKQYLDGAGIEYTEDPEEQAVVDATWDQIEEIFAKLHETYPDKFVVIPGVVPGGSIVDPVGGDNFGVLDDPANSMEIVDMFKCDTFKERCERNYRWNQMGYISKDAMSDTSSLASRFRSGNYMSFIGSGKPGYKAQFSAEAGEEMIIFNMKDEYVMKSSAITGILWHLNQNCEDKVAAIQLMDALFSDADLSNLIMWGEEGVDYVFSEDGHIKFPEGMTTENAQYYHMVNWELPNQFIAHIWEGSNLDLWEKTAVFNDEAPKSKALGFMFDNSELSTEFAALTNIYDEYYKQIMLGFVDYETGVAELEEKLDKAGYQKYMEAKQAALNEWAAANGK